MLEPCLDLTRRLGEGCGCRPVQQSQGEEEEIGGGVRKREDGLAVFGESVCSPDQQRRAFLHDHTGV